MYWLRGMTNLATRPLTWWFLSVLVATVVGTGTILLAGSAYVRGEAKEQATLVSTDLSVHEKAKNPHEGAASELEVTRLQQDVGKLQEDVHQVRVDVAVQTAILKQAFPRHARMASAGTGTASRAAGGPP